MRVSKVDDERKVSAGVVVSLVGPFILLFLFLSILSSSSSPSPACNRDAMCRVDLLMDSDAGNVNDAGDALLLQYQYIERASEEVM